MTSFTSKSSQALLCMTCNLPPQTTTTLIRSLATTTSSPSPKPFPKSSPPNVHFRVSSKLFTPTFPPPPPPPTLSLTDLLPHTNSLITFLKNSNSEGGTLLLTGAGLSTSSGIPDYRGSNGSYYQNHTPTTHQQFINPKDTLLRQRYWGRSIFGYSNFHSSKFNDGHRALTELSDLGMIGVNNEEGRLNCITQNVDGFHQDSGMSNVVNLHGNAHDCECLACGFKLKRIEYQKELALRNQPFIDLVNKSKEARLMGRSEVDAARPDGDANVEGISFDDIVVPPCPKCGTGIIKPSVVFFGASVVKETVNTCMSACDSAGSLLVIGSSLTVFSAFRFVKKMSDLGKEICILNVGETRGDVLADLKIEVNVNQILRQAVDVVKERGV